MHMWGDEDARHLKKLLLLNSSVVDCGCVEWNRCLGSHGYGEITYKQLKLLAHRLSFELHVSTIPEGMLVCHACDNRKCINPKHLFVGSHRDNFIDMVKKGRRRVAKGGSNFMCKLSDSQVRDIRKEYATTKTSHRKIAKQYGVNHRLVGRIIKGEERRHA